MSTVKKASLKYSKSKNKINEFGIFCHITPFKGFLCLWFFCCIVLFLTECGYKTTVEETKNELVTDSIIKRNIFISSIPDSAYIFINGKQVGKTNKKITISDNSSAVPKSYSVTIKKDGYASKSFYFWLKDTISHYHFRLNEIIFTYEFNPDSSQLIIDKEGLNLQLVYLPFEDDSISGRLQVRKYMGMYEITQKQWKRIMFSNPSQNRYSRDCSDCPVENISKKEAEKFCKFISDNSALYVSLPLVNDYKTFTKKYAQKPSDKNTWHILNAKYQTHPVGTKQPVTKTAYKKLAVYDLYGNVAEWVIDFPHTKDHIYTKEKGIRKRSPRRGVEHYSIMGTHTTFYVMFYGGSIENTLDNMYLDSLTLEGIKDKTKLSTMRDYYDVVNYKNPVIGFRVVAYIEI